MVEVRSLKQKGRENHETGNWNRLRKAEDLYDKSNDDQNWDVDMDKQ